MTSKSPAAIPAEWPEMTLRAPSAVPPMVVLPFEMMPVWGGPTMMSERLAPPAASVPMRLPRMRAEPNETMLSRLPEMRLPGGVPGAAAGPPMTVLCPLLRTPPLRLLTGAKPAALVPT
jgi:hypothetical protein